MPEPLAARRDPDDNVMPEPRAARRDPDDEVMPEPCAAKPIVACKLGHLHHAPLTNTQNETPDAGDWTKVPLTPTFDL
eukprot:1889728-Heterocapsa_arctica.AAC.1